MRSLGYVLLLTAVLCTAMDAQTHVWKFEKVVLNTRYLPHGLAMDPDGNLWVDNYAFGSIYDSIYVVSPDGVQLPFSPIGLLTYGTDKDTVKNGRGIVADQNGNLIWAGQSNNGTGLFRIDYKTGMGIDKVHMPTAGEYPSTPGVDSDGNIYVGTLIPPWKMYVFDNTLTLVATVFDTATGYPRSSAVSPDGKHFFAENDHYESPTGNTGFFDDYVFDQTFADTWTDLIEVHAWDRDGNLWIGQKTAKKFYAIDVSTWQVVDSLYSAPGDTATAGGAIVQPHGIAFSVTGDTAYVADFVATGALKMYIKTPVTAVRIDDAVPEGYALEQNFPNPFNPSTEIRFSIGQAGFTTVRVYDMLGREVAQLVNQDLEAGTFTATFNATNLTSGTYVYEVVSGGVRLTNKMMLLK